MAISLNPVLQFKLEQMAAFLGQNSADLAEEAIRQHLAYLDQQAIQQEITHFTAQFPELKERFFNQYIAMHHGEVIDWDNEFEPLVLRIQEKMEGQPVLIRQVTDSHEESYSFRGPRLDKA